MRKPKDNDAIMASARQGLALNLKELAIATGYGYSTVRVWHKNGTPPLDGKITRREAIAWRKSYEKSRPVELPHKTNAIFRHPLL